MIIVKSPVLCRAGRAQTSHRVARGVGLAWRVAALPIGILLMALAAVPWFCNRAVKECCTYLRGGPCRRVKKSGNRTPQRVTRGQRQDPNDEEIHMQVSSALLWQCWHVLTRTESERMVLLTGTQCHGTWVLSSFFEVEYLHASLTGVAVLPKASHAVLARLDKQGHYLLAALHSHPGTGKWSVRESATDRAAQRRYEQAGYQAFSGIVTRDGYFRVFTDHVKVRISIFGKGVEDLGHGFYKLHVA